MIGLIPFAMKERRLMLGYSQDKLATLVGATRQTINIVESGGQMPNVYLAQRISKALYTNVEAVFPLPANDPLYERMAENDPLGAALLEHEREKE